MGYLLWFLSILIRLTAKQIAELALELIRREIAKQRNRFFLTTRRPRVVQGVKKPAKQRWEDSARFYPLSSRSYARDA
jgi:hypothetical protein